MTVKNYLYFPIILLFGCGQQASEVIVGPEILYVGTFSVRGSQGVYVYQFDRNSGTFQAIEEVRGPESPSYLDLSPDGKFLFTVNRASIGSDSTFGSVCSYRVDSLSGKLKLIDQSSSFGEGPCHVSVDESGRYLFLSHYTGGSISVLPVLPDGAFGALFDSISHQGHSLHKARQEAPHVHAIQTIPGTNYFLAADLGTDKLYCYEKGTDGIQAAPISPIELEPGSGPRHFALSADQKFIYISEELSSSVSVHALDLPGQTTTFLQRLPTLPEDFQGQNTVADIHISPDKKFLYVSNRGHDSLAIYEIAPTTGTLRFLAHQSTGGKIPRNFLIDPQGDFILVANQDTDDIIYFKRDRSSGLLEMTETRLSVPSPVCLQWLTL